MNVKVFDDTASLGKAAAGQAATAIRRVVQDLGRARIIAATGASQFEFLDALTREPEIDWQRVEVFHLDEYIGLPFTHAASFRKYLLERLIRKTAVKQYHLLDGDSNPEAAVHRMGEELKLHRLTSHLLASVRMAMSLLTILLRTSRRKNPTWSSTLTKPAVTNRWVRDGSPVCRKYPGEQSRCRCGRF